MLSVLLLGSSFGCLGLGLQLWLGPACTAQCTPAGSPAAALPARAAANVSKPLHTCPPGPAHHTTPCLKPLPTPPRPRSWGAEPQWAVCGETFPVGCRFHPSILHSQFFSANPDRRRRAYSTATGMYAPGCGLNSVRGGGGGRAGWGTRGGSEA